MSASKRETGELVHLLLRFVARPNSLIVTPSGCCGHIRASASLLACVGLIGAYSCAQCADSHVWPAQSIYQIITDRFYDGDPSNNNADGNYDPAGHRGTSVHGGDFKGIEQKLDYIKGLGATAIWISPIVLNARGEYHGYAGLDFYKVDPHWGSLAELQRLIQAAHARGILVIDDIVVNHSGRLLDSGDPGYPHFKYPPDGYNLRFRDRVRQFPPPFELNAANPSLTNLFHNNGFIEDFTDPVQMESGELKGLNDFRTESAYVRTQMANIYEYWIEQAGFDGYRVDTVQHVEMDFWRTWCPAVHAFAATHGRPDFFMFGEILSHSDAKCASYVGAEGGGPFKLDSALDYPLYFEINSVFASATGNTKQIADHYAAVSVHYDPSAQGRLVTFLDNHDQPRFLSTGRANNNIDRLKVALTFLYTTPGIPCLYYGTEQAFNGKTDPYDREDMFAGQFKDGPAGADSFNMTHPLFQWVAMLNNFRRLYAALQSGVHSNLWSDQSGPGLLAYTRQLDRQEVLVVLNTASSSRNLPGCPTIYPAGTELVNRLDPRETITVLAGSRTSPVAVPGTSAKIFVARSQMLPLDPVVADISPAHDAKNVRTVAPIVIRFSQPMDTGSVEAAFATVPTVHGSFSLSPSGDTMTFTPRGPGFPPQVVVQVRIGGTARAATSGHTFFAAFESRYETGPR